MAKQHKQVGKITHNSLHYALEPPSKDYCQCILNCYPYVSPSLTFSAVRNNGQLSGAYCALMLIHILTPKKRSWLLGSLWKQAIQNTSQERTKSSKRSKMPVGDKCQSLPMACISNYLGLPKITTKKATTTQGQANTIRKQAIHRGQFKEHNFKSST